MKTEKVILSVGLLAAVGALIWIFRKGVTAPGTTTAAESPTTTTTTPANVSSGGSGGGGGSRTDASVDDDDEEETPAPEPEPTASPLSQSIDDRVSAIAIATDLGRQAYNTFLAKHPGIAKAIRKNADYEDLKPRQRLAVDKWLAANEPKET